MSKMKTYVQKLLTLLGFTVLYLVLLLVRLVQGWPKISPITWLRGLWTAPEDERSQDSMLDIMGPPPRGRGHGRPRGSGRGRGRAG